MLYDTVNNTKTTVQVAYKQRNAPFLLSVDNGDNHIKFGTEIPT